MKSSGLADSPFFRPAPPSTSPPVAEKSPAPTIQEDEKALPTSSTAQLHNRADAQPHERTTAQTHKSTNAQLNERTDEQPHNRADTQPHERTTAQSARPKNRESYDVYVDQAQAIEELRLKLSKERRQYITKGQVMRELLDEILPSKR